MYQETSSFAHSIGGQGEDSLAAQRTAGWSSPVARKAHILEAARSNRAPVTDAA